MGNRTVDSGRGGTGVEAGAKAPPKRLSRSERNRVLRETRRNIRLLSRRQLEEMVGALQIDLIGAEDCEAHAIEAKFDAVLGRLHPLSRPEFDDVERHPIPESASPPKAAQAERECAEPVTPKDAL